MNVKLLEMSKCGANRTLSYDEISSDEKGWKSGLRYAMPLALELRIEYLQVRISLLTFSFIRNNCSKILNHFRVIWRWSNVHYRKRKRKSFQNN